MENSTFHPSSRPHEGAADGNGNGGGIARVLRGGSWNNNTEINLRSTYRTNEHPTNPVRNVTIQILPSPGLLAKNLIQNRDLGTNSTLPRRPVTAFFNFVNFSATSPPFSAIPLSKPAISLNS